MNDVQKVHPVYAMNPLKYSETTRNVVMQPQEFVKPKPLSMTQAMVCQKSFSVNFSSFYNFSDFTIGCSSF